MAIENPSELLIQTLMTDAKVQWPAEFGPLLQENTTQRTPPSGPYGIVHLLLGDNAQISLGNNPLERSTSILSYQIFDVIGVGTAILAKRSDFLKRAYKRRQIKAAEGALISFRKPGTFRLVGRQGDIFYMGTLFLPFEWDTYT